MFTVKTNIAKVTADIVMKLKIIINSENVGRAMAVGMLPEVQHRIHVEGKAADGSQIGNYSVPYLRRREKKYGPDPKVILSDTRSMQNNFIVSANSEGKWGLGWLDDLNFNKAKWNEERYGKPIFKLTETEKDKAGLIAEDYLKQAVDALFK